MALIDEVNEDFASLLSRFPNGISNTSTAKYGAIKQRIASSLGLQLGEIYATGATKRASNFDTRLAQGNQRNQHAALALGFFQVNLEGQERAVVVARSRESFIATTKKFVTGEERGTTFDAVLGFIQVNDELRIAPLVLLTAQDNPLLPAITAAFPTAETCFVTRAAAPANLDSLFSEGETQPRRPENPTLDPALLSACAEDLEAAGMRLPKGMLGRYLAALLTNRFVILSGLSGSGKTKLAFNVASWFREVEDQIEVVAVGADWTSNEHVLGYRDALDDAKYRRPINGALDLILAAIADSRRPYFLILDEMNLSHVERYFADLLSALESGQAISLHANATDVEGVPPRIVLPANLFLVGTVNVDETTYTFSSKVLDRASVLEFRATEDDMAMFLHQPLPISAERIEGTGRAYAAVFVNAAAERETLLDRIADGDDVQEQYAESIGALFRLLAEHGAEFGYRTAREIARFTFMHAKLAGAGWSFEAALDAAVIQKIMPKLHGSERRLRPLLDVLGAFCEQRGLTLSQAKVGRMKDRLRDGFASFLDS